jgi:hypothetical protein
MLKNFTAPVVICLSNDEVGLLYASSAKQDHRPRVDLGQVFRAPRKKWKRRFPETGEIDPAILGLESKKIRQLSPAAKSWEVMHC